MTCAVVILNWLLITAVDCCDGHVGVKSISVREAWLNAVDRWMNGGSNVSRCGRNVSRSYETLRTGAEISGEDFQNTGTFIVVRSSVFAVSIEHSSPLARDAYNALWDSRRRSQVRKHSLADRGNGLFEDS